MLPSQMSIVDDFSRRWTDILWSGSGLVRDRLHGGQVSRIYYGILASYVLWSIVCAYLFSTYGTPKLMTVVIANLNNVAIGLTSFPLWWTNRRLLPPRCGLPGTVSSESCSAGRFTSGSRPWCSRPSSGPCWSLPWDSDVEHPVPEELERRRRLRVCPGSPRLLPRAGWPPLADQGFPRQRGTRPLGGSLALPLSGQTVSVPRGGMLRRARDDAPGRVPFPSDTNMPL